MLRAVASGGDSSHEPEMWRMIREIGTIRFHPAQKAAFKRGELSEEWIAGYPHLFDESDARLIRNQRHLGLHFVESLAAVTLHVTTGYTPLYEHYEREAHERKHAAFRERVGEETCALISRHQSQAPDLFFFRTEPNDWFFCEVKGPRDKLGRKQRELFNAISHVVGRPVWLLNVKDWRPAGSVGVHDG